MNGQQLKSRGSNKVFWNQFFKEILLGVVLEESLFKRNRTLGWKMSDVDGTNDGLISAGVAVAAAASDGSEWVDGHGWMSTTTPRFTFTDPY
jgi:hypothetical protein